MADATSGCYRTYVGSWLNAKNIAYTSEEGWCLKLTYFWRYKGINPQDQGLELFNIKLISPTTKKLDNRVKRL